MKKLLTILCAAVGIAAFGEATRYVKSNETIDIAEDISVDQFSVEAGTMVKEGEGTLEIGAVRQFTAGGGAKSTDGLNITINNGAITTKGPLAPIEDETLADRTLAKAYLHYDASVAESIETDENGVITKWKDLNGNHDAVTQRGTPTNRIARLNGLNTIDFCSYKLIDEWPGYDASDLSHRAWMQFDQVYVKSGFVIFKDIYTWQPGWPIADTDYYMFHRAGDSLVLWYDGNNNAAYYGEWRVDGMRVFPDSYKLEGSYHVVSFRLQDAARVSAICSDRRNDGDRCGGAEVAEIAYFEDALSDDEMRAVEEKLLAKWFNKPHPAELASELRVGSLSFGENAESSLKVSSMVPVAVDDYVDFHGVFTKKGDGDLDIVGFTNLTGVVVEGGSMSIGGSLKYLLKRAFIHLDPSDASSVTTNSNGEIERMDSLNGNGRFVFPHAFSWGAKPTLMDHKGKPVIDCGAYAYGDGTGTTASALEFSETCVDLYEAFVVCYRMPGSTSFLLGDKDFYNFHASGDEILLPRVIQDSAQGWGITEADWRINEQVIDPSAVNFADELAVYSVNHAGYLYSDGHIYGGIVSRLGSDRDICAIGGIQYGEVILFNEYLTDDERDMIRNYLIEKWTDHKGADIVYDALKSVEVKSGATFDFGGHLAVANALSFGFAADTAGALRVKGRLSLGENITLELDRDSIENKPVEGKYKLIEAAAIDGIKGVEDLTLSGSLVGPYSCALSMEDGALYATIRQSGMIVIIR